MKKILLSLSLVFCASVAKATLPEEFNYIPISSYTDAETNGPVLFTSAAVQFVGVSIASPATGADSYIAFYRSTSPVLLTSEVSTQTLINTSYSLNIVGPVFIPLFDMKNDSFTFVSKVGKAQVTYWLRYPVRRPRTGNYPGLPASGLKTKGKIEYP